MSTQQLVLAPPSLWGHQLAAMGFVLRLWQGGRRGAMLSMWMGTGKSRVAIELANEMGFSVILILCPLRVVEVWREQFEIHLPGSYEFLALDERAGKVSDKARAARDHLAWCTARNKRCVICINYESAKLEPFAHWALQTFWPLVVCDESHRLKSASGATSRFAGRLAPMARYRLALTGTPMPHSPLDVWAQFRFLDRSVYDPTYTAFKLRHAVMGGFFSNGQYRTVVDYKDLEQLREKFFSLSFQVGPEVLDLPGERDQNFFTDLEPEGSRIYKSMESSLIALLESGEILTAQNKLVALLRLQQITGGTIKPDEGAECRIDHAKEKLLEDLLEDLPEEEPVIVFGRFKADLRVIQEVGKRLGRRVGELSGDRDDLDAWQRGSPRDPVILATQIQKGGVGISLVRAAYAIYFSTGFYLADYLQSRARLYRAGQRRGVSFYHLFCRNTIDVIVARALSARQDLIESVLKELKKKCSPHLPTATT